MTVVISGTTGLSGVDGSAGTPAIQGSDTNTGVLFPAADTVAISTGGSERLRVDISGNVGIGTSSPGAKLDVSGSNAGSVLSSRILNTSTSASSDTQQFIYVNSGTAGDPYTTWTVGGVTSWSAGIRNSDSDSWYLSPGSSLGTTPVMAVTTGGNVGIGTSSPVGLLHLNTTSGSASLFINSPSGTGVGSYLSLRKNDSAKFLVGVESTLGGTSDNGLLYVYGSNALTMYTNGVERMRVNAGAPILCLSGGNTSATGTGIAFPATQSASSDVNTLDDYEEGTWTPSVSSGITSPTYTTRTGTYKKIGNLVCVTLSLQPATGTLNGSQLIFSGLPFSVASVNGAGRISYSNSTFNNSTTTNSPNIYATSTTLEFYQSNGGTWVGTNCAGVTFDIRIEATYFTST